jgi:hypothetical protein
MPKILFSSSVGLLFLLYACTRDELVFGLNEEVTIPFDQTAVFTDNQNEISLHFKNLDADSRCLEGQVCIWQGRAVVDVKIDNDTTIQLAKGDLTSATDTPFVDQMVYRAYIIHLKDVDFGKNANQGKENKYSIIVEVKK